MDDGSSCDVRAGLSLHHQGVTISVWELLNKVMDIVNASNATYSTMPPMFGRWDLIQQVVPTDQSWKLRQRLPVVSSMGSFPDLLTTNSVFVFSTSPMQITLIRRTRFFFIFFAAFTSS